LQRSELHRLQLPEIPTFAAILSAGTVDHSMGGLYGDSGPASPMTSVWMSCVPSYV
jgi:hypothetical protein